MPEQELPTPSDEAAPGPESYSESVEQDDGAFGATDASESDLSNLDVVIGFGILLVLMVLFNFVRKAVTSHLVDSRATPNSAERAGWGVFAFLTAASATGTFAALGDLWRVMAFILPFAGLTAVTLLLALMLYLGARSNVR